MIPYLVQSRLEEARHEEVKFNLLLNKIDLDSENQKNLKHLPPFLFSQAQTPSFLLLYFPL